MRLSTVASIQGSWTRGQPQRGGVGVGARDGRPSPLGSRHPARRHGVGYGVVFHLLPEEAEYADPSKWIAAFAAETRRGRRDP